MDNLKFTKLQLEKHLALLEDHLLWSTWNTKDSCYECIYGHLIKIEGYLEEGLKFSNEEKFWLILKSLQPMREDIFSKEKGNFRRWAFIVREWRYLIWSKNDK
jgi:hypothetical protein